MIKHLSKKRNPWLVAAVAFDGLPLFEFSIIGEVFGLPRPEMKPWYQFTVGAVEPGMLQTNTGTFLNIKQGLKVLDRAGTILIPGWRDVNERPPRILTRKLQRAHEEGARIGSICSAAFVLAEAGLLDGKRATTHWRHAKTLATRYPTVRVEPDVLYIENENVLTSAGSAAGIDLCLHLVRHDCGMAAVNTVARRLVVPPHRSGGQKQYIDTPITSKGDTSPAHTLDTIRTHLEQPHSVRSMAKLAGQSERTFARQFEKNYGTTPYRWLTRERVKRAQSLLESTQLPMDQIAEHCGFSDAQVLRLRFKEALGTTPSSYRKTFHQ